MAHAETIIQFSQEDEDVYLLRYEDDDGEEHSLSMGTMEAMRLYNLLRKTGIPEHVSEMEAARASYERGEGPNGEAPGTWELEEPQSFHWRYLADLAWKAHKEAYGK